MRLLRALTPLVVGVLVTATAPSALAAFPGTNGLLVGAPVHGPGLQLIDPHGHGLHTICTNRSLCGTPTAPHFSSDGQAIAFSSGKAGRPVIVATDGTCLWCLLGPALSTQKGAAPAFKANGQTLTLSVGSKLLAIPLTGGSAVGVRTPTPGATGPITGAVWSSSGALAFTRAGFVWLLRPHHAARPLGPGTQPVFSPDAKRLAFVRNGWVWVASVGRGAAKRLVKGGAPAFSPDGRALAFIAHGANVYIVGVRGGRPRLVPGIQARSVDWQPLTPTSAGRCSVPPGASVVAQTAEALVTYSPGTPQTPWYGCLQATGHRWPLVSLAAVPAGTNATVGQVQGAGRFVVFLLTTTDASQNCANAVDEVDLGSGKLSSLYSQTCTASSRGVDSLALDSSGFTAWRTHQQVATPLALSGVACPSSSLCVAVDGHGNAAVSTTPTTAGSWSLNKTAPAFTDIRCPSATLCVGLDGGQIVTTTSPTGGPAAWSAPVTIDSSQLTDVACAPSSTQCVAVDNAGNVLSSTSPTSGAAAWQTTNVDGTNFLSGVSCPSTVLCVAVGQGGDVLTSSDPWAATPSWSHSNAESTFGLFGVSCPSSTFCVSSDSSGNLLRKQNPGAGGAWTVVPVPGESGFIYQPVCPSSGVCLARDGTGHVITWSNPASTSSVPTTTDLGAPLTGLSCERKASGPLCAASDTAGQVHVTSTPTMGGWSTEAVDVPACAPCIAEQLFARDDRATQALDAVQPGPGNVLANVSLGSNSTILSWTHSGTPHSYQLR